MMLPLSKQRSIFIHAIIIAQQDEMFVSFFISISDRNIPLMFVCSIDIIILL